jgi:hypothetical protein
MPIFYCAGGEKRWRKSEMFITENTVTGRAQFKPQTDARERRVADRRVWSLAEPARPVMHPGVQHGGQMRSNAVARPITFDRTRPVTSGPLLDSDRMRLARPVSMGAY